MRAHRIAIILALVLVGSIATRAHAQPAAAPAAPEPPPVLKFLTKWFQIREAFDGGKGESTAAAIGLVAPGKDSPTYWLVDAGVRLTPQNLKLNTRGDFELFYFPTMEWHHMSAEPLQKQDNTNKAGPAFNTELWFPPITDLKLRTYVTGKGSLQRNFIKDTTENSATFLLGMCAEAVVPTGAGWENGVRPCAELTYNGTRRSHYYPYVGFEHYGKLALTGSGTTIAPAFDGSLLLVRVQADAFPFNVAKLPRDISGWVLNIDYTYRHALDDVPTLDSRDLNALKFSTTYFFVKGQVAGVGIDLAVGRMPEVNFVSQRRAVLAFRIKTKS